MTMIVPAPTTAEPTLPATAAELDPAAVPAVAEVLRRAGERVTAPSVSAESRVVDCDAIPWTPFPMPGTSFKLLNINETTGAATIRGWPCGPAPTWARTSWPPWPSAWTGSTAPRSTARGPRRSSPSSPSNPACGLSWAGPTKWKVPFTAVVRNPRRPRARPTPTCISIMGQTIWFCA